LFSEFSDAFSPADAYLASVVNRRRSNYPSTPKSSPFSYTTELEYKDTWKAILRVEVELERIRKNLKRRPFFSVYDAFEACDVNEDGVVTKHEV